MSICGLERLEARLFLSGTPVTRPASNTGTGFFVLDGRVYDANGYEFIMKGPNAVHAWGSYTQNYNTIDHIARTGANAARVVTYQDIVADPTNSWTDSTDTPARRQAVVERYLANGVVPVIEDHASIQDSSSQSSTAALHEITTHWLNNASWLKQYESGVILNIANEWGPPANASGSNTLWRDTYITQVGRLRAGPDGNLATSADNINCLIMIDAGQWGQDYNTLALHAQQVLDADPQHNIVFSIHLYGQWRADDRPWEVAGGETDYGPWDTRSRLSALLNRPQPLPLVIGEWAWEDFRDFSNLTAPYAAYRTQNLMEIADDLGIGWFGWSWNQSSPTTLNMVSGSLNNYQYNSNTDLSDWGDQLVNDPQYGTKTSQRATIFPIAGLPGGLPSLPSDVRFILEGTQSPVAEGGQGAARVNLSKQPAGNVTVNLSKISGGTNDGNLNLVTTSLTFTTANWNEYQPIIVSATADADTTAGTAKFQLAGSGLVSTDFLAKEIEPPAGADSTFNPDRDRLYNGSGTATSVQVTSIFPPNGAPNGTLFMRFNLANLSGKIASATLRLFTTNTTANRLVRVFGVLSDTWTESTNSGINASFPLVAGDTGTLLPTSGGAYVDISLPQLTRFVSAQRFKNGLVSLAIRMVGSTATFQTREGVNKPELIVTTVEAIPPTVNSAFFDYAQNPDGIRLSFSENVSASLAASDLVVESLTDPGTVVTVNPPTYDPLTDTATFLLTPATLANGNYVARLLGSAVSDAAGNALLSDVTVAFFSLAGDINRDRAVDITDLSILATHWQQSGAAFGDGDLNSDGTVDITDLSILATNWQATVAAPAPARLATFFPGTRAPSVLRKPAAKSLRILDQEDLEVV